MELLGKNVLVIGLGISGVSTVKALDKLGAKIWVTDSKSEEELGDILSNLADISLNKHLGVSDMDISQVDFIVKSPGVPPSIPILRKARDMHIEIMSDIELAYRLNKANKMIAITGTNGKTTTTSLVGEVLKAANLRTHVVGNIGRGILDSLLDAEEGDIFLIEASSFQLEDTNFFKPKVSLILNLAPDHLDWHKSYDNYIRAKKKIFINQDGEDYVVLNYDDALLRSFEDEIKANIIWFSTNEILDQGIYIDGRDIVIKLGRDKIHLMQQDDMKLLGRHNLENVLACIGICYAMGVDLDIVKATIQEFKGVEHRLEYVMEWQGISYYNDSKGTNPEASIKAIEAIPEPIILIAGGYDKASDFDDFVKAFKGKVKTLILLGETKYSIKASADKFNFKDYHIVESLEEAVQLASRLGNAGDHVLLSPACASWDMFNSFEERGRAFKDAVFKLRED
ncbi:MAG: UDP-N-acetylmuramoyl-L-alanine--D-glutamate ligase [Tissierellaceae bacterium]|jgi:UDP-N-acetylmuramoylalanine--D-glutamate ligase|nr:UDP-N-acetylmuramoyl-L-alanine--D-glutamate ligase [Tissierellia bacterium]